MQNCNKVIISCATAAFSLLCGCTSGEGEGLNDRTGRINLSVTADKTIEQVTARSTDGPDMSFLESLSAQDLAIVLQSTEGESYSRKWSSLAEFPAEEEFPVGNYMITAYYGQTDAEGYNQPFLYGTTDFSVISERETEVSLTATIANSIVYIEPTDNFRNYFQTYSLSITSPRGYSINIADNDARPVYVNPGTVTINASVTLPSGRQGNITLGRFTAKATTLQRVTLNVENNSGDAVLSVEFDETLAEEQIRLNLSEDLFNAAPPEINTEGFTSDNNSFSFVENTFDGECAINIAAQAGLANAKLIISDGEGEGTDYDLLDPESLALLSELGIKFINVNTGSKLAKINLKEYLDNLESKDLFTSRSTSMKLEVTDALTRSEEIALNTEVTPKPTLTIEPLLDKGSRIIDGKIDESYLLLDKNYRIKVLSNVGSSEKEPGISLDIADATGNTLDKPTVDFGEKPGEFIFTFNTPVEESDFKIVATANKNANMQVKTGNIHVPRFTLKEIDPVDVWATHTHFVVEPIVEADRDIIKENSASIMFSGIDKAGFEERNGAPLQFDITGLTPGKTYDGVKAYICDNIQSNPIQFTTETADQLKNAGMDDWYNADVYTNTLKYGIGTSGMTDIKRWFPNSKDANYWQTNNPETTSQTSGVTCYYTSFSGTIPVTGVSGSAAEISTLGYGEGTTYTHTKSGVEYTAKKHAAGLLYTGESESKTGVGFASRPTSISFKYKFKSVNDENFKAYIMVEHRENEITTELGKGELISNTSKENFSDAKIEIKYTNYSLKATHITVYFISSTDKNPKVYSLQGSKNALNGYSDSKYVGNVLTVDDIVLNY